MQVNDAGHASCSHEREQRDVAIHCWPLHGEREVHGVGASRREMPRQLRRHRSGAEQLLDGDHAELRDLVGELQRQHRKLEAFGEACASGDLRIDRGDAVSRRRQLHHAQEVLHQVVATSSSSPPLGGRRLSLRSAK